MVSRSSIERTSVLALSMLASVSFVAAGPCDIYSSGGTPCVAAHATTRALYDTYNGPLYQVQRSSDSTTTDIYPVSAGGVANGGAQNTFCSGTSCVITIIYDQSGNSNDLTQSEGGAQKGPNSNGSDYLANAVSAPVILNGAQVYGVYISPGTGYRNNNAKGTATGDEPEGIYAVLDGTHYNNQCCFDYGNAEISATDTGNGHMEAIYFGDDTAQNVGGAGAGSGPWIMADFENGLYSGLSNGANDNDPSIDWRFLTAIVKGEPNHWAIRGGNAASGGLSTYYEGARPDRTGYNPMSKEGAIILGTGGDNSPWAQGTFYEGVMTIGYPSDDTEDSVQANIVAAGYAA